MGTGRGVDGREGRDRCWSCCGLGVWELGVVLYGRKRGDGWSEGELRLRGWTQIQSEGGFGRFWVRVLLLAILGFRFVIGGGCDISKVSEEGYGEDEDCDKIDDG